MIIAWLLLCLLAIFGWGAGGLFGKMALQRNLTPYQLMFLETCGVNTVVFIYLFSRHRNAITNIANTPQWYLQEGFLFAIAMGVSWGLAHIGYNKAMGLGDAGITTAFTATYPVVTVLLLWILSQFGILQEKLTLSQIISIVGIVICSIVLVKPAEQWLPSVLQSMKSFFQ